MLFPIRSFPMLICINWSFICLILPNAYMYQLIFYLSDPSQCLYVSTDLLFVWLLMFPTILFRFCIIPIDPYLNYPFPNFSYRSSQPSFSSNAYMYQLSFPWLSFNSIYYIIYSLISFINFDHPSRKYLLFRTFGSSLINNSSNILPQTLHNISSSPHPLRGFGESEYSEGSMPNGCFLGFRSVKMRCFCIAYGSRTVTKENYAPHTKHNYEEFSENYDPL